MKGRHRNLSIAGYRFRSTSKTRIITSKRKVEMGGYTYQSYASLELYRGTKGRIAESSGSKDSKVSHYVIFL